MNIQYITNRELKNSKGEIKGKVRIIYRRTKKQMPANFVEIQAVLDEGIDVPDADVAIIVSGTGSERQMIQRIGRVVRASEGKKEARVYEIISRNTIEEALSENRHPSKFEVEEIECRRILHRDLNKLLRYVKNVVRKYL